MIWIELVECGINLIIGFYGNYDKTLVFYDVTFLGQVNHAKIFIWFVETYL
jgi:hypothetical protein